MLKNALKKNSKWRFRSLALILCLTLLMGTMSISALARETSELDPFLTQNVEESTLSTKGDLTPAQLADCVLPEEDIPEMVSDEAIAKKEHVSRLREQETDLNTVIFQNRDGNKSAYVFT